MAKREILCSACAHFSMADLKYYGESKGSYFCDRCNAKIESGDRACASTVFREDEVKATPNAWWNEYLAC